MERFLLKKLIIISFFLAISFIIEMAFTKVFFGDLCQTSFLKLELLPLFLIGFFFGFKYSFFSILLYSILHIFLESIPAIHQHNLLKHFSDNMSLVIGIFIFIFIIPYLLCSLTSFFSFYVEKDSKIVYKNKNIFLSLILTTILQIISYAIFVFLFYGSDKFIKIMHMKKFTSFNSNGFLVFLYFFLSIICTNSIIVFCIIFLKKIFKENIDLIYLQ
ncbi:hypothetical protein ['Camptotheca acuminata' phytoplasma]|uniref:hypothetical protein n=1 Tax='Camptotheca acuminata' phytoplasma TaxID=3239192 RepID=UPI00351A3838